MKKLLLGILAIIATFSLAACGQKEQVPSGNDNLAPAIETKATPELQEEEQVGIGNTDEGMVALVLEQYILDGSEGLIDEVVPTNIHVYTAKEISDNEALKDYTINEGDIVFSVDYDLKIAEGVEDMNQFTAGSGEIDGNWIRNKSNVGVVRNHGENGYSISNFGTGF